MSFFIYCKKKKKAVSGFQWGNTKFSKVLKVV